MKSANQTQSCQEVQEEPSLAPLRYNEKLMLFSDVIKNKYQAKEVFVYRVTPNECPNDRDLLPQHRCDEALGGLEYKFVYTEEDVQSMTSEEKVDEVSREAISVFKTEQKAIKATKKRYKAIQAKFGNEEAEAFKLRLGCYVMRLHIKQESGLTSNFHPSTQHANVLLRENVHINDVLDTSYQIQRFSYDE